MANALKKGPHKVQEKESAQFELIPTNNHNPFWQSSLFNEVYLLNDVPVKYKEMWEFDEAGPFYSFCNGFRNLCEELKDADFDSWSERNTINRIIKPILRLLGYCDKCSVNQEPWAEDESFSIKEGGDLKTYKPDLIIVNDPKELKYIERKKGQDKLDEARSSVIVPIEAKYWDRIEEDDRQSGSEDAKRADKREENDSTKAMDFEAQCLKYMDILNKDYGILTDGKTWRLFSQELSNDSYRRNYQFNLGYLIKHVNAGLDKDNRDYETFLENAKYFFHFFSKKALYSETGERRFVDDLLEYSKKYVAQVEQDLKERFVKAMAHACNGYLRSVQASKEKIDLSTIRNVAESHLFNILFIKHCEARNILPFKQSPGYRKISISNIIDKLEHFNPEREEDNLNHPLLRRMFSKDFSYDPNGTELYDRLLKLTKIVQEGSGTDYPTFEVSGFRESVFSKDDLVFVNEHKLQNAEMINILFELGYCTSSVPGKRYQQIPYSFFSPRQLGSIYESFLEFRLDKAEQDLIFSEGQWQPANLKSEKVRKLDVPKVAKGRLFFTPDNKDRKLTGSYYTPDYVVRYITEKSLAPLIDGKRAKDILELKVCDPAMGSGHFLGAALHYLASQYLARVKAESFDDVSMNLAEAKAKILDSCICGYDINPRAVKLAKMSLWLESAQSNRKLTNLKSQLRCEDYLDSVGRKKVTFQPTALLTNPPYGENLSVEYKNRVLSFFPEVREGRNVEIYQYFLYACGLNLKPGGVIGFICPNTWLTAIETPKFRAFFFEQNQPSALLLMPSKVFEAATVDCLVYVGTKKKCDSQEQMEFSDLRTEVSREDLLSVLSPDLTDISKIYNDGKFSLGSDGVIAHLSTGKKTVNDYFDMIDGIDPYKTKSDRKHNYIVEDPKGPGPWKKVLASGKCLKGYSVTWDGEWIKYGDWLHCPRNPRFFEQPKVLIHRLKNRSCKQRLTAGFDDKNYYTTRNLTPIHSRETQDAARKRSLFALCVLLNSRVLNYWYGLQFDNVNILTSRIREIPLPDDFSSVIDSDVKKGAVELPKDKNGVDAAYDKLLTMDRSGVWGAILKYYGEAEAGREFNDTLVDLAVCALYGLSKRDMKKVFSRFPTGAAEAGKKRGAKKAA
ncbi:MAG: N-6 DNA methylase [Pseudobdellovibrionaceae bacterium]